MLREDDPVYYKRELNKLLNKASSNNLKVFTEDGYICFRTQDYNIPGDNQEPIYEQASVALPKRIDKGLR